GPVDPAADGAGAPPAPVTGWARGSLGRRETVPSSDVDSALAWQDTGADQEEAAYLARLADAVNEGLRACGVQPDEHGAGASNPLFARSLASWRTIAQSLSDDPTQENALIFVSMITDSRPLWESGGPGDTGTGSTGTGGAAAVGTGTPIAEEIWRARSHPDLLRLLAQFALQFRPPTGFLRDFVVEHSGERKGQLDIKHGGLTPITDLARWAGMAAGATSG